MCTPPAADLHKKKKKTFIRELLINRERVNIYFNIYRLEAK